HVYATDSSTGNPGEELLLRLIELNKTNIKQQKAFIDLTAENLLFYKSKSFFVSLGWPPDAADQKCFTAILLMKSDKSDTYSRSLYNEDYRWVKFWDLRDKDNRQLQRNTIYCIELDEMR